MIPNINMEFEMYINMLLKCTAICNMKLSKFRFLRNLLCESTIALTAEISFLAEPNVYVTGGNSQKSASYQTYYSNCL